MFALESHGVCYALSYTYIQNQFKLFLVVIDHTLSFKFVIDEIP